MRICSFLVDPIDRRHAAVRSGLLVLCWICAAEALAQTALVAPVRSPRRAAAPTAEPERPASAAAGWTLQTRGEVSMQTPVVRMRDVAMLVGGTDLDWDRIGGSAIALLPTDGRRLSIERQRLADVLARHLAGKRTVHWVGPDLVSVRYAPDEAAAQTPDADPLAATQPSAVAEEASRLAVTAESSPVVHAVLTTQTMPASPTPPVTPAAHAPLAATSAERLIRLVHYAVDRVDPAARDQYDVQIDARSPALAALADARTIRLVQSPGPWQPGPKVLVVEGDLPSGTVSTQLPVTFQPRPLAVFSTQSIRRGDLIRSEDVELRPLGRGESTDGIATDLQGIIGMEARNSLPSGRAISSNDIGLPIIIRRGDLVEVRVVGGSVIVRTSARAMNDGSEGELLQVETQTPRRRLMARAVSAGVVEIITRPPQLSP